MPDIIMPCDTSPFKDRGVCMADGEGYDCRLPKFIELPRGSAERGAEWYETSEPWGELVRLMPAPTSW